MENNWSSLTQEQYIAKFKEYIKQTNMEERNLKLSLEAATELYKTATDEMKTILENTFPELVKSKYPMSHDELQESLKGKTTYYINHNSKIQRVNDFDICDGDDNRNIIHSEQRAKELLAFTQLIALRDKWNEIDGFEPTFLYNSSAKYCIVNKNETIQVQDYSLTSFSLAFKCREVADLFLATFKDLIEEAKNLI